MYKIVGADGQEYGPVSLAQIQSWLSEGRVNRQSRVQPAAGGPWKTLAEFPELAASLPSTAPAAFTPPPLPPTSSGEPRQGLAIASLVLGILSLLGCFFLAGIPAIVCGHLARSRAKHSPQNYRGGGLALAGLITGYLGTILTLMIFAIVPAMLLPALSSAKERAQSINCINNMKSIGLSCRTWSLDNQDHYPWGVSVTNGGTAELAVPGADHLDLNPIHFEVLSNELSTPKILLCPADHGKTPALHFYNLQAQNVSYQLHTGSNVSEAFPNQVLAICPIHGHVLTCDGSVQNNFHSRTRF